MSTRHTDYEWIMAKIGGHGGSWRYKGGYNSRASIGYIGGVSRYKILWYNLQLFIRYRRRKRALLKRMVKRYSAEVEAMDRKLAALGYKEYSKPRWKRWVKSVER